LVADSAAVAAAAAKAAAKDKAAAEAAAAFAAEMRMTRQTLHMAVDGKAGPEAAAMMTAEEPRAARPPAAAEVDEPEDRQPSSKRRRMAEPDAVDAERKAKISHLTDLCDRLLQRGVLVYDSTREQLAIEVRERRGEQLGEEGKKDTAATAGDATAATPSDGAAAAAAPAAGAAGSAAEPPQGGPQAGTKGAGTLLLENKRCTPAAAEVQAAPDTVSALIGAAASDSAGMDANPAGSQQLLWQLRWGATPDQIHGPFDSVTMHGWTTQGCFAEERPAEVRQCNEGNEPLESCWHKCSDISFDLYL